MSMSASFPKRSLSVAIYEGLRQQIVQLEREPGTFIYENAIAEEYGASRTPVRQAMARLEQEQLLEILPQRGARVAPLSMRKLREAQEVRVILEVASISHLAAKWDSDDPEFRRVERSIVANLAEQDAAADEADYVGFTDLDSAFHGLLMHAAGNETLRQAVEAMRLHLQRLRYIELQVMRHDRYSISQHRDIIALVKNNDVAGAEAALTAHLRHLDDERDDIFAQRADLFQE